MLFRKKLFKRSNQQYLPHQTDEMSKKMEKQKKNVIQNKAVQVLKMCRTVKNGGCIGQHVFHGEIPTFPATDQLKTETNRRDICALKKAKLACLESANAATPQKSSNQIYNERRVNSSQNLKMSSRYDEHPAFRSTLFMGGPKKEGSRQGARTSERGRKLGNVRTRTSLPLQSIQECEDEHLYHDP